jgi:hypothetical protein
MKGGDARRSSWTWSLALVASVYLLTMTGAWTVTDHGELLYMAGRMLSRGTLDLWDPGEPPPTFLSWPRPPGGGPIRSRFVPVPSLTLLPLLWLDRAFGWGERDQFGRLVHLQGHVFVLSGLALLGVSLRRLGASPQATAVAIVLTGLCWPVWMVGRRLGPEPILVFLVSVFLAASNVPSLRARLLQGGVCLCLPWTHGTGSVVSAGLVLAACLQGCGETTLRARAVRAARSEWPLVLGSVLGIASFVFFWNHLYHGHWLTGGYAQYAGDLYQRQSPLLWARKYASCIALGLPLLLVPAWLGRRAAGPHSARVTALTLTVVTLLFTLITPFSYSEPARRIALLVPAWGLVLGMTWDRLHPPPVFAQVLTGLALVLGLFWFLNEEGGYYFTSRGIFYFPVVLWLSLLNEGRPWAALLPVGALLALLALAWARTWALLRGAPAPLTPSPDAGPLISP